MIYTKIADTYRYEQFLKKPDFIYEFEMLMHSINFNSNNKSKVKENLIFVLKYYFVLFYSFKVKKLIHDEKVKKIVYTDEELDEIILNSLNIDVEDSDNDEEDQEDF